MRVVIVVPALPPKLDGIGDYTALLAAQLGKSAEVRILTARRESFSPIANVVVEGAFDPETRSTVWNIEKAIAGDPPDWVLLQYNPFHYGRFGLNLQLPRMLAHLRRSCPGVRLAVMIHETYVPMETLKFAVMGTWQRWQLYRIGKAADVLFFSIEAWARSHEKWFSGTPTHHLPVGSNIPRTPISRAEARGRLGISDGEIVLGIFGSTHPSRMFERVGEAAQALLSRRRKVRVLHIGPDAQAVRGRLGNVPIIADGPLEAAEVSRRLSAVDIYLSPFVDGVSTRRTVLMAGLQHGLPVVGTIGIHTDSILRDANGKALLLAAKADGPAFCRQVVVLAEDADLRRQLSIAAAAFYCQHFAWEVIASKLISELQSAARAL